MNDRKVQGSILVEALLAVVVLSVGLTLILQGMSANLRVHSFDEDYTVGLLLLKNKMTDYLRHGFIDPKSREEGEFAPPYEQYTFEEEVFEFDDGIKQDQSDLTGLTLTVAWNTGKKNKKMSAATLIWNKPPALPPDPDLVSMDEEIEQDE